MTLGELNKNITKVGKDLKKISSGQRLTGAGDGASDYAISEKMRVRIRALGQNERNVQTGANLLRVAEGGVQQQLEILKTIKEKVLDANNDSNTDIDRATIQKEINQGFQQMEQIAQETNYNGKRLLAGDVQEIRRELVPTIVMRPVLYHDMPVWVKLDEAQFIEGSDLGIIPDEYPTLDGIDGPFDVFQQVTPSASPAAITSLGLEPSYTANAFSGGEDGDPKVLSIDLATSYANPADLDGKGFSLGGSSYVFSYDSSKIYDTKKYTVIDISSCANFTDVASRIDSAIQNGNVYYNAATTGSKVTFSTRHNDALATQINQTAGMDGVSAPATTGTRTVPGTGTSDVYGAVTKVRTITSTGAQNLPAYLKGGEDGRPKRYGTKWDYSIPGDVDSRMVQVTDYGTIIDPGQEGKYAEVTRDFSTAADGTGVKIHGSTDAYLFFVDGNDAPQFIPSLVTSGKNAGSITYTDPPIFFVGKDYTGTVKMGNACGIDVDMTGGLSSVTFRATIDSSLPNDNWYVDNVSGDSVSYTEQVVVVPGTPAQEEPVTFSPVTPLNLASLATTESAKDATYAHYAMNLTGKTSAEDIIENLHGTSLIFDDNSPWTSGYYFLDSAVLSQYPGDIFTGMRGQQIDLNEFRKLAQSSGDVLGSLQEFLKDNFQGQVITTTSNGIDIQAMQIGTPGNNERIYAETAGTLRHYDIDFSSVSGIPDSLIGKGFRVYCATDDHEWWNFEFTSSQDPKFEEERGESGTDDDVIKTIRIDISGASSAGEIAEVFYKQANKALTEKWDHFLRVEANTNTGLVRLYDNRLTPLTATNYDTLMGKGGPDDNYGWWKIADGVFDNIYEDTGDRWIDKPFLEEVPMNVGVRDFVIQDSPKANMNIRLKLPQTTLDMVLDYDKSEHSAEDFNVMTKEMREKLLGFSKDEDGNKLEDDGILDKGIKYLTDANVLIGSQITRLNLSERNIVTANENTQASESTIRDADMAKEMMSYTKNNVLAQAAQSMLAQANQNASSVIGLLQ